MKIVYIANSTIPSRTANGVHVMKMCQAFRQHGHSVTLVAKRPAASEAYDEDNLWQRYGIPNRFDLRRLALTAHLPRLIYALRAALFARGVSADLVYTRNFLAAPLTAWLGLPTIYGAHGICTMLERHVSFRLLCTSRNFRRLVAITHAVKRDYLARFPDLLAANQVEVLPDAVDFERFANLPDPAIARRRLGWAGTRLTVGYAGHMYAGRGIELILALAARCPGYDFRIIGGNEEDIARYRREAESRGLDHIHFVGFVPNGELPWYLAACDVLLMLYQRRVAAAGVENVAAWMSPMKMFEYMATGRLIISSDLPVLREVLNGHNAVLCSPVDIDQWQAMLDRAACDESWRQALGAQARQDVSYYTWLRRAERVLSDFACS